MNIYRHGDLTLLTIAKSVIRKLKLKKAKDNVLALGETTGHRHVAVVDRPDTLSVQDVLDGALGVKVMEADTQVEITHQEHKTLVIPKQDTVVLPRREYDWFAKSTRTVKD